MPATRRAPPLAEDEAYQCDRRFALGLAAVADSLLGTASAVRWEAGVAEGLARGEQRSPSSARAGLRVAIQDLLEMTRDLQPDALREADARLQARGLPTLSEMRLRVWSAEPDEADEPGDSR